MVDAALNVAAEQVVEHSAYGALLQRDGQPRPDRGAPEPVPERRRGPQGPTGQLGGDRGRDRRPVDGARAGARASRRGRRTRRWPRPPGGWPPTTPSTSTCRRGATSGRPTRSSTGSGRPASRWQGDAAPPAGGAAAAAGPRVLRGGRPSGDGPVPAQHPAVPLLPGSRALPHPARAAAGRAQRRAARRAGPDRRGDRAARGRRGDRPGARSRTADGSPAPS